jgi:hypothetical protein
MSMFDSIWDTASRMLDKPVDNILGDRMRYWHDGVWLGDASVSPDRRVTPGFVVFAVGPQNIDEIDETLGNRKRVKIARDLVDMPNRNDRIQHPKLGPGWFCPSGAQPETEGRYWIFDVQGASKP